MTLFISKYTNISQIEKEFDFAIIYNQPKVYDKLSHKKVLLGRDGYIEKENFFKNDKANLSLEAQKHIFFRLFLIEMKGVKYKQTLEVYGKRKMKIEQSYNSLIYHQKYRVSNLSKIEISSSLLQQYEDAMFEHFLDSVAFYHGKKYIKIYHEALYTLFNISNSLFTTYLYQNFIPIKEYRYLLYSYSLYFSVGFLKKYKITIDDVDEEYRLRDKSVSNIYKLFTQNLSKLNSKDFSLYHNIENELERIAKIEKFEV